MSTHHDDVTQVDEKGDPEGTQLGARTRTLTEKGDNLYASQQEKHLSKLKPLWNNVAAFLQEIDNPDRDFSSLDILRDRINTTYQQYHRQTDLYIEFLQASQTKDSERDLETFCEIVNSRHSLVNTSLQRITDMLVPVVEPTPSIKSKAKSYRTNTKSDSITTTSTSTVKLKRAKAEAAKAKVEFAEQQAHIKKQQAKMQAEMNAQIETHKAQMQAQMQTSDAEFQADLDVLAIKQEAAAAEAEARVFEEDEESQNLDDLIPPKIKTADLLHNYVNQQADMVFAHGETEGHGPTGTFPATTAFTASEQPPSISATFANLPNTHALPTTILRKPTTYPYDSNIHSTNYGQPTVLGPSRFQHKLTEPPVRSRLNTIAPNFIPPTQQDSIMDQAGATERTLLLQQTSDITKFLLKKDLLFSRLTTFDDKPESYQLWKSQFKSIANELSLSDPEQLDLLVKWLGTESSPQAKSIMECNANNPSMGIKCVWERLDMRYGAPEMVEHSIKTKLENFPVLTDKDNHKLFELYDILSEIEYLKENPTYRNLLGYFDSSSGVRPIVWKLPYSLQEKWTDTASEFMREHDVVFPPFQEFVEFIGYMSKFRNNPALQIDSEPDDLTTTNSSGYTCKNKVNVHKSDFNNQTKENCDIMNTCIIHKTAHSLTECRAFRAKPIDERKKLLKEHNICYKCCDSTSHKSRDCTANVSCRDCGSKQHNTAMHISRNSANTVPSSSSALQNHGGESRSTDTHTSIVSSLCTAVCDVQNAGKSCAKILPVFAYHRNNPSKRIKMYAVIDDQSNRSLAKPDFFRLFDIRKTPEQYTLSTCSEKIITCGRKASDFIVESFNGDTCLNLPALIECESIPDNRDEIPTPEAVADHPHLKDLIGKIPAIDNTCQILLLLGRDILEAHHVLDQRLGPPRAPYAQQLKFGWVVVGDVCSDKHQTRQDVYVKRTRVQPNIRSSLLEPCANMFTILEHHTDSPVSTPDNCKLSDGLEIIKENHNHAALPKVLTVTPTKDSNETSDRFERASDPKKPTTAMALSKSASRSSGSSIPQVESYSDEIVLTVIECVKQGNIEYKNHNSELKPVSNQHGLIAVSGCNVFNSDLDLPMRNSLSLPEEMWRDTLKVLKPLPMPHHVPKSSAMLTTRFTTYLLNRLQRTKEFYLLDHWKYVPPDKISAELCKRLLQTSNIHNNHWLIELQLPPPTSNTRGILPSKENRLNCEHRQAS